MQWALCVYLFKKWYEIGAKFKIGAALKHAVVNHG